MDGTIHGPSAELCLVGVGGTFHRTRWVSLVKKREKSALFPGCLPIQCQQWAEKTAAVRTVAARGGRPRAGPLQKLAGSSRGVLLGTREDTVSELDQPAGEMP